MKNINFLDHNESAWDKNVDDNNIWSIPVNIENLNKTKKSILN